MENSPQGRRNYPARTDSFSKGYAWVRSLLPSREDVSECEHPLTREELATMTKPFIVQGTRYFRLPFVPLIDRVLPSKSDAAWRASNWILQRRAAERYASGVVTKLQKAG